MISAEQYDLLAGALVADILREAQPATWRRRAAMFDWAKPTLAESTRAAPERLPDLRRRWRELDDLARACRHRAEVCDPDDWLELTWAAIDEHVAQRDLQRHGGDAWEDASQLAS